VGVAQRLVVVIVVVVVVVVVAVGAWMSLVPFAVFTEEVNEGLVLGDIPGLNPRRLIVRSALPGAGRL